MLDVKFVRENLDAVAQAMENRNASFDAQAFSRLDAQRREAIAEEEHLQAERNSASKEIGAMMKDGRAEEAEAAKERVRALNEQLDAAAERRTAADAALRELLLATPNMPDATTPVGKDENDNPEVRRWGTPRDFDFEDKPHWDLGADLGIIDSERGV